MLREEIFGPVAPIQKFSDTDEVIAQGQRDRIRPRRLSSIRATSAAACASREKLDFGMIGLNRGIVSDPAAPFGGMKQSGIGREGAHEGIMEFLETQYVSVNW